MDNSRAYIIDSEGFINLRENHSEQWNDLLDQIAVLRWGYDDNKLDGWVNTLKNDLFSFNSFFVFAVKDHTAFQSKSWKNMNRIGFAYFCQDKNDGTQWYCGDFVIHTKYKRLIASKVVCQAVHALKERKASKLFMYIDKNDKSSILLHKKLSSDWRTTFIRNENQDVINAFDKNYGIVYQCMS